MEPAVVKFPKEALVFEAMRDGDVPEIGDESKAGEIYEFYEPAYAENCIRAFKAFDPDRSTYAYLVLDVKNLRPLTKAAAALKANLPMQTGGAHVATESFPVVVS